MAKRYDKRHRLLKPGESVRSNGAGYMYRWSTPDGKRHSITTKTLEELREKEAEIANDKFTGLRTDSQNVTVNQIFQLWADMKRGLQDNTFQNYCYMYNMFVKGDIGFLRIRELKRSDVKQLYNKLLDERGLKINTIDNVHTVLHQVLTVAVEDGYMRTNVSDNLLKELKQSRNMGSPHRKALTVPEQNLFMDFLAREDTPYHHWKPIFTVLLYTGLRAGEVCGLRWCDIDLEEGMIDVNHTLVYYSHAENGCYFNVHQTKTRAGTRIVPMLDEVKEAFLEEKHYQEFNGIHCRAQIDGYTDFIFVNRYGDCQHHGTLNKALRRIIRDCNDAQFAKGTKNPLLLPSFSCHSLRHTFTTRLVEAGVNIKVVQETLGHADFGTTMDIYTDVTKELKQREFDGLQEKMRRQQKERRKVNDDSGE